MTSIKQSRISLSLIIVLASTALPVFKTAAACFPPDFSGMFKRSYHVVEKQTPDTLFQDIPAEDLAVLSGAFSTVNEILERLTQLLQADPKQITNSEIIEAFTTPFADLPHKILESLTLIGETQPDKKAVSEESKKMFLAFSKHFSSQISGIQLFAPTILAQTLPNTKQYIRLLNNAPENQRAVLKQVHSPLPQASWQEIDSDELILTFSNIPIVLTSALDLCARYLKQFASQQVWETAAQDSTHITHKNLYHAISQFIILADKVTPHFDKLFRTILQARLNAARDHLNLPVDAEERKAEQPLLASR